MRVLLVQPTIKQLVKGNNPSFVEEERGINPPLGLMYIASYLLRYTNHQVDIYDGQLYSDVTLRSILGNSYDVVGITVLTFTLIDVINTINTIRDISPQSKIVVGGIHPTIYPFEMLKWADFVVRGEGEHIFPVVLNNLNSQQKIYSCVKFEDDLDKFPYPYRTNINKYNSVFSKGISTTLLTSRGCSFGCAFCHRATMGRSIRYRSTQNIMGELDECLSRGIKDFQFYDDTFTINKKRVMEICDEIIKNKMKIKFDVRTRVDVIDEEMLKRLKQAGMKQIRLGIESGVQRVLDKMKKGITLQEIEKAFRLCGKLKIETIAYAMVGNPGETIWDIYETLNFIKKVSPNFIHIAVFTPYPSTESYREWVDKTGKDVWRDFATNPQDNFQSPVWGDIPRKDLESIVNKFYKEFYIRPSYILKTLWKNPVKFTKAGLKLMKGEK